MPTIWGLKAIVPYDPIGCDQRGRTQDIPGSEFPGLSRFRKRGLNRVGTLFGVSPQSLSFFSPPPRLFYKSSYWVDSLGLYGKEILECMKRVGMG